MARRKSRGRGSSRRRSGRGRAAPKRRVQRSKQTTIVIKRRGRPDRTTIYEEYYEEEW